MVRKILKQVEDTVTLDDGDVFNADGLEDVLDDGADTPEELERMSARRAESDNLFAVARAEDEQKEKQRVADRQVGLLIGPKNLERLRAFGYDVNRVAEHLSAGTSHSGIAG